MNYCYIFGSVEVSFFPFDIFDGDLIIAADKGLLNARKFNLESQITVGDFDSLGYTPEGENIIKHPVKKDETDLILAVDTALKYGYTNFRIFGCLGGRLDQTIASIQTAEYIKSKGGNAVFYSDTEKIYILHSREVVDFSSDEKGVISVFSYSDTANITISGLLYELNNHEITNKFPLGVSNEFINSPAHIKINDGKVLIIQTYTGDKI